MVGWFLYNTQSFWKHPGHLKEPEEIIHTTFILSVKYHQYFYFNGTENGKKQFLKSNYRSFNTSWLL